MKLLLLFVWASGVACTLQAQHLERMVISSAGDYQSHPTAGSLHWTIGEVIVEEFRNGQVLSQGFQQGMTAIISAIDWGGYAYYLEVAIDPDGGTGYIAMGSSQLVSVPYALYANQAGNQTGGLDNDNDPANEIQQLRVLNDSLFLSRGGGAIPLPNLVFSIPVTKEIDLPNNVAFGIANTTSGVGIAIAGRQGAGSSMGVANSAAVFGTSEQGFGVVGFSSGNGTFAGVLGRTNDSTGTGVIGSAEGSGRGGFFQSSAGAALITGGGNVGIGTDAPEVKLEVNGDMRVNANAGKFILGIPDNGNQWTLATNNNGAHLLFGTKPDTSQTFVNRMTIRQDGRIGIGVIQPGALLEIAHNSTNIQPQLLLTEKEADFARLSFQNNAINNVRWNIDGLTAQTPAASKLNFRFQNNNVDTARMTILGNGHVGIGNIAPDEELVIGDNIGSTWVVPSHYGRK